jgi:hypothetical protein
MGLAIAELDSFTMGMIFDLVDEYVKTHSVSKNKNNTKNVRKATQTDFDRFLR